MTDKRYCKVQLHSNTLNDKFRRMGDTTYMNVLCTHLFISEKTVLVAYPAEIGPRHRLQHSNAVLY